MIIHIALYSQDSCHHDLEVLITTIEEKFPYRYSKNLGSKFK